MSIWEFEQFDKKDLKKILKASEILEEYGLENDEMLEELRAYLRKEDE